VEGCERSRPGGAAFHAGQETLTMFIPNRPAQDNRGPGASAPSSSLCKPIHRQSEAAQKSCRTCKRMAHLPFKVVITNHCILLFQSELALFHRFLIHGINVAHRRVVFCALIPPFLRVSLETN
jgi:hypothetical protein